MTRQQLGAKLGVTTREIQKFETGVDRIGPSFIRNIVAVMEVPPSFLFEGLAGALSDDT